MAENEFACLTYHLIGPWPTQYAVCEEDLRAHLSLLKSDGYTVEGFRELEHRLRSGIGVPRRYVVLTIDDGHESSMLAADLLQQYGYQATFFLTRDRCLGKAGYVHDSQIRELWKRGFSLGTHGTTHHALTFLSSEQCAAELAGSKEWLEDVVGEEIRYTAAPGGFVNRRVLRLVREQGYVLTGTCNEWLNSPAIMTLPGAVNRVNIRRHFGIKALKNIVEGHKLFFVLRQTCAAALMIPKQVGYVWYHRQMDSALMKTLARGKALGFAERHKAE